MAVLFYTNYTMKKDYLKSIRDGENLIFKERLMLVVTLALPAMLANLSSIMMEYIDSSMVGRLGANASASIGLIATSTWLFGSMCLACSVGFTVQVAQKIGAKDNSSARRIMSLGYRVGLSLVLVLVIVGVLIAKRLPVWLGGTEKIIFDAYRYFLVYILTLPVVFIRYMSGAMLQATGNMKLPSILNITSCILDVFFNYIYIFVLRQGVLGAALGTTTAEIIVAALMLYSLLFKSEVLGRAAASMDDSGQEQIRHDGSFVVNTLRRAAKIAIPVAIESIVTCGAQITSTVIVAPLGTFAIAANSFSVTVESLCYMPCYGIGAAATTMIGQSVGASRKDLAKKLGWLLIGIGFVLMIIMGAGMYAFAPFLIGLLSPVDEIRTLGTKVLRIEAFAEPLYGSSIIASYVFRGAGDTLVPTLFTFFSMWVIRIPTAAVLAGRYGLSGVWFAMAFELCVRGLLFLIRMKRGRWLK